MSLPSLHRSSSQIPKTKHMYTSSLIDRAPSVQHLASQSSVQVFPHISITGIEQNDNLFQEVFLKIDQLFSSKRLKARRKRRPKSKESDFFYQLLFADSPNLETSLKDLLCIAELGIPQGDLKKEASICIALGDQYYHLHKTLSSIKFFKRALKDFSVLQDLKGKSIALNRLSLAYFTRGKMFKAKESIKKHRIICDEDFVPVYNLGIVDRALGFAKSSAKHLAKSLHIAKERENKEEMCFAYAQLGLTFKAMEQFDIARSHLAKAAKIAKNIRAFEVLAEIKIALAYLCFYQRKMIESKKYFWAGMVNSTGYKSEICRINIGIISGEEKIKKSFEGYSVSYK